MIIGVMSDTHGDKANAIPHIIQEFEKRKVELIVHCGDIEPHHINPKLFNNHSVVCALVDKEEQKTAFKSAIATAEEAGWIFTRPGDRIVELSSSLKIYVGHKRTFDFLTNSEEKFSHTLEEVRRDNDGLRWMFGGHLHFQIFKQGHQVNFLNPGAVENSMGYGYEWAVIDTNSETTIFGRILPTQDARETMSIGIISDSADVAQKDPNFWEKLAKEFADRDVKHVIHCGGLSIHDVGREELENFQVYCSLRTDQLMRFKSEEKKDNMIHGWHLISAQNPIVQIEGYCFYVGWDLGFKFLEATESQIDKFAYELKKEHPVIKYLLCGFTNDALMIEGQQVTIINPGDINKDRNFAVVCVPRNEITFGRVPVDPLPVIKKS